MTLYDDAAAGTLDAEALSKYRATEDIDSQGPTGFTPLGIAARNGHTEVVRLLLDNNAKADALSSQDRTPLFIVTARGKGDNRAEIVDLLLKHGADAKYSKSTLQDGATPLVNELRQLKDPEVIQLLVKNGGTTDAATKLAVELNDPRIDEAMKLPEKRNKLRSFVVDLITSLILFVVAWANTAVWAANEVFKKFGISGDKESPMAQRIGNEVPPPKTKEEFKESIGNFVKKHKLDKFFPAGDNPLLETIVAKALELQNDKDSALGSATSAENLVQFALYQPVIYCDDSGSMDKEWNKTEDRWADQHDLVKRISAICTKIVPDDLGVHLRFINAEPAEANDLREDGIERIMSNMKPWGATEIGTHLRQRILEPLVYNQPKMTRPLFVSITTDGIPEGGHGSPETKDTIRDEIINCQNYLLENGLPPRAVVFQISQIGSDPKAKEFLKKLSQDPNLENVYVTSQQLDANFRELRENERELEAWLFQTLLNPILDLRSD